MNVPIMNFWFAYGSADNLGVTGGSQEVAVDSEGLRGLNPNTD